MSSLAWICGWEALSFFFSFFPQEQCTILMGHSTSVMSLRTRQTSVLLSLGGTKEDVGMNEWLGAFLGSSTLCQGLLNENSQHVYNPYLVIRKSPLGLHVNHFWSPLWKQSQRWVALYRSVLRGCQWFAGIGGLDSWLFNHFRKMSQSLGVVKGRHACFVSYVTL